MARFVSGRRVVTWELHEMDCRLAMGMLMDADSVDSVVCDPPYGLSKEPDMAEVLTHWLAGDDYTHGGSGFMGKSWDSFVPGPSVWREAYRVLKPGGYLVAFFGTRTYDLGVLAIRLAGFEIRDQTAWLFGSGFPKSHDVSKGIDKLDAAQARLDRAFRFTEWMRAQGITAKAIDRLTDSAMGSHYTTHPTQPAVATRFFFEMIRPLFTETPPEWIEQMVDQRTVESENYNKRAVTGVHEEWTDRANYALTSADGLRRDTAHTPEAAKWQGWGTAQKPAFEPIVIARKPLAKGLTVAANVLRYGTGAINIDGCRVGTEDMSRQWDRSWSENSGELGARFAQSGRVAGKTVSPGRWPANVVHDGSPEVVALFPDSKSGAMKAGTQRAAQDEPGSVCYGTYGGNTTSAPIIASEGSAARFFQSCPYDESDECPPFYHPKASKADRNAGLDDAPEQPTAASQFRPNHTEGAANGEDGNPYGRWKPTRNNHPTVKPTALMQWLVRLVTPPGGTVLDPFMGSGSTGIAAVREGFSFVGCEMTPEYISIARARIDHAVNNR